MCFLIHFFGFNFVLRIILKQFGICLLSQIMIIGFFLMMIIAQTYFKKIEFIFGFHVLTVLALFVLKIVFVKILKLKTRQILFSILDLIILKMATGRSFRRSFEDAMSNIQIEQKKFYKEIYHFVVFSQQEKSNAYDPFGI